MTDRPDINAITDEQVEAEARKFRKKPIVIEAWQVGSFEPRPDWLIDHPNVYGPGDLYLEIKTLEGTMRADRGDWVIRGVQGELYPCKPDIFAATYEPAAFPPRDVRETEYAWLIELKPSVVSVPTYWGIDQQGELDWTKDHMAAIRFARKDDAKAIIKYYGWTEADAVEHAWADMKETLEKIAYEAGQYADGAEDAHYLAREMARIEAMARDALQSHAGGAAGDGWRDISTAPKDGTEVLLSNPTDGYVLIGHFVAPCEVLPDDADFGEGWDEPDWFTTEGDHLGSYIGPHSIAPTHWQPVPKHVAAPAPGGPSDD